MQCVNNLNFVKILNTKFSMLSHKNFPLVSIAVCTFNGDKFLHQQLESLINQTYKNIEIVIVDDCSTDNTKQILSSFSNTNEQIRCIYNENNLGFTKNFEKAMKLCRGEYIAICDQDDIWDIKKIEILINNIGDHGLIFHDSLLIDKYGKSINGLKLSDKTKIYDGNGNLYFLVNNCVSGHACLFTKEVLQFAMPFDHRFFHDWWLAFVASSIGTIKYLPYTLVQYRQHNDNITDILNKKAFKAGQPGNKYITYNIAWIEYASRFKFLKNSMEINYIHNTLKRYDNGKKGVNFLYFLIKFYSKIFNLEEKSSFSKLNLIRKIYFAKSN